MIVTPFKENVPLERLAIENSFLKENLENNLKQINKRKEELFTIEKQYQFEIILKKNRKTFAFQIETNDEWQDEFNEIMHFFKNILFQNNKIKILYKIKNVVYIKTKYNQVLETSKWFTPQFTVNQLNPKLIFK